MQIDAGCHCGTISFEAYWCRSALDWVMELGSVKPQLPTQR